LGSNIHEKIINRGEEKYFLENIVNVLKKNKLDGIGKSLVVLNCALIRVLNNFCLNDFKN
jgi:hypothetical protein